MKFIISICFCILSLASTAQKNYYATLRLVCPMQLAYDTLLVKNSEGKVVSETSALTREGKNIHTYLINVGSITEGSFSIYFGGSLSEVNDTLFFLSHGKDLLIEIKDSFALRDRINFKLRNVYNFNELYKRYNQYCDSQMQKYFSLIKPIPDNKLSEQQYSLNVRLDFVKKNKNNPYTIDLFAFYVLSSHSTTPNATYSEINSFYIKNLKNNIKNAKFRTLVESKIEHLKQSLNEGSKSPAFSARSIDNKLINSNTLLGKNILLTFWATWCEPCMKELPYLKQINEKYKGDNLVIISVSLDRDSIKMANMVKEKKLNWVQIFNNKSLLELFRINPIPAIFLIDEKGLIQYNSINRDNETADLEILRSLLKEKFKH